MNVVYSLPGKEAVTLEMLMPGPLIIGIGLAGMTCFPGGEFDHRSVSLY